MARPVSLPRASSPGSRRARSATRVLLGAGLLVLLALPFLAHTAGCGYPDKELCAPQSSGFGDAQTIPQRIVLEGDRVGACNPRIEVIRSDEQLRAAFATLQSSDPPAIDWTKESVVLREATLERGVRWLVNRGDDVTVGLQGCLIADTTGCHVVMFQVPIVAARVESHECKAIDCPVVSNL